MNVNPLGHGPIDAPRWSSGYTQDQAQFIYDLESFEDALKQYHDNSSEDLFNRLFTGAQNLQALLTKLYASKDASDQQMAKDFDSGNGSEGWGQLHTFIDECVSGDQNMATVALYYITTDEFHYYGDVQAGISAFFKEYPP